ncbi:hypothetical protein GALMADRAFT_239512 [Galerina marginata CBS 339.88]|uniref:EF hand associated type-2 domain-containing protein n=1 Tax=Galerina marginata (strain CBS 339.88) TaxID=685588 RepID=A0A067TEG0_GALM3|nr:hypothetical protein GALMADRAFT_239512 [Galerina marginata CBS 339.88]
MAEDNSTSPVLLDDEGAITNQLETCLKHIFAKYCTPAVQRPSVEDTPTLLAPPPNAYLSGDDLQRWAVDTNGEPFSEETREEVVESFDVTEDGNLTFKGFLQLYQLQTENDEAETWKDLRKHGFNQKLSLVTAS